MSTELKELRERITKDVRNELLAKIKRILELNKHLKEEPRLRVVLKELAGNQPFFVNNLDKTKINNIDTKEYFERTFVERVTTKFIETEQEVEIDQSLNYFFEVVLPEFVKTYHYRYTYTESERQEMLGKYADPENRELILSCIIQNIETSKAIFGIWGHDMAFITEPDNTLYLRQFLNMEDLHYSYRLTDKETNVRDTKNENYFSESSRKRQAIAFYYLLNALGVKNPESNKAAFARFLAFMSGYEGNPQNILNTAFYKAIKKLFGGRSGEFNEKDMVAVKDCFECLKPERGSALSEALELLKKDMEN